MKYKNIILTLVVVVISAVVVYNSIYIEKLDEKRQKDLVKNFKPKEQVDYFWKNKLKGVLQKAIEIKVFDSLLHVNPQQLFTKYGRSVGISSDYCFLVKGQCKIDSVKSDELVTNYRGYARYQIPHQFIFSNTARDAVGFFNVDDFANSLDFNAIASEMNAKIMNDVIKSKINMITPGVSLDFSGAVEIDKEQISRLIDVIPLKIKVIQ